MDQVPSDPMRQNDQIGVRLSAELRTAVEEWARNYRRQTGENVSMSEAVRLLLAQALGLDPTTGQPTKPAAKPRKK